MVTYQKTFLFSFLIVLGFFAASCKKQDANLDADYNSKKAEADKLIQEVNTNMSKMKTDHTQWMADLDQASKKPHADTAKANSLRNDMKKHEDNGSQVMALVDSVKLYDNATPDQGDQYKNADDRLGTNFNDLSSKWKSYQDEHTSIMKNIQSYAVNTAGDAAKPVDSSTMAKTTSTAPASTSKTVTKAESHHVHVTQVPSTTTTHTNAHPSTPGTPRRSGSQ